MDHETTRDQKSMGEEENNAYEYLELPDIPIPETDNVLYSILSSLNQNIADFYTYLKFKNYLSEDQLNVELLKKSMSIHRDFAALFLHTKEELVLIYPDFIEVTEKLLFKGQAGNDSIKFTQKICKAINDYKIALHREGYLQDFKRQLPLTEI